MTDQTNSTKASLSATPGPINEAAVRSYFERGAKLKLQSDRSYWTSMFSLMLNLMLVGAIIVMLPLKTVQTVTVRETSFGELHPDFNAVDNYVPDANAVSYFVSAWVENVMDINASIINDRLVLAGNAAVGDAADELKDLIKQQNPLGRLHQYPSLRRTYKRLSFNLIKSDTAVLRYSLTERTGPGATPTTTVWVMTINFTRVPPHTQEQVMQNPAGLYITSFNNNQESVQ